MAVPARLTFVLPGEWWTAPVDAAPEVRAQAIAALVASRYGRRDDLARVRAEHRVRLGRALDQAIGRGASQYRLSLANEGGVAFASTLGEYPLPPVFGGDATPEVLADRVVGALSGGGAADPWEEFAAQGGVAFAKGDSIVLRRLLRVEAAPGADDVAESLTADYWITVPERAEVVLVTLSTVLLQLEPLMLELFDRVIAAAEWGGSAPSLRAELLGADASAPNGGEPAA